MSNYPDGAANDPRAPWNQIDLVDCQKCDGTGELPHDCGEDTCCCSEPETEMCDECDGEGYCIEVKE